MNAQDAWRATLGQLQIQLNRATYDTWLRHADLLAYEDGRFVISVPHAYAKDWIDRHLLSSMVQTLSGIFKRPCQIQVIVWDPVEDEDPITRQVASVESDEPVGSEATCSLNPNYTFETFVLGESNRYAGLLARAVVDSPIGKYSPVLFQGGMGMGKTHLLQAVACGLIRKGLDVVYVTAEELATELFAAIRSRDTASFRERFRQADAVLVDDLQFVEGKESAQNEIVAIWDALRNRRKTMIFASDRLPCDMNKVSKDARSRFQAGPIAALESPDLRLRLDILDAKCAVRQIALPPALRDLIASHIQTSGRDLEAAVEQLCTYAQLTGSHISEAMVLAALKTLGTPASQDGVDLQSVVETTAAYFGLTADDLSGRKRTKEVAHARQVAMYLARSLTDASLPQIGSALGGRDHSTVVHGCNRIADLVTSDVNVNKDVEEIRGALTAHTAPCVMARSPNDT